jgi:hypothetical protein
VRNLQRHGRGLTEEICDPVTHALYLGAEMVSTCVGLDAMPRVVARSNYSDEATEGHDPQALLPCLSWTPPAITSASNVLVLLTWVPAGCCEANRWSVPRSFGRSKVTDLLVVLIVTGWWPLRWPGVEAGARW